MPLSSPFIEECFCIRTLSRVDLVDVSVKYGCRKSNDPVSKQSLDEKSTQCLASIVDGMG